MVMLRSATSFVALALLGCLISTWVEAQDLLPRMLAYSAKTPPNTGKTKPSDPQRPTRPQTSSTSHASNPWTSSQPHGSSTYPSGAYGQPPSHGPSTSASGTYGQPPSHGPSTSTSGTYGQPSSYGPSTSTSGTYGQPSSYGPSTSTSGTYGQPPPYGPSTYPSDPYRTSKPQKPSDPQHPTQPQKPSNPQRPTQPQKPSNPQRPTQPQKPSNPQRPTLPQKPSNPQPPTLPQKPSNPQRQTQPQTSSTAYPSNTWASTASRWTTSTAGNPPPGAQNSPKQFPRTTQQGIQIPNQQDPLQSGGTSPSHTSVPHPPAFQSCEVHESQKILCGSYDISPFDCEAISCCYDGQRCYFGKAVTVQCTKDGHFIMVIAKDATLPNIDLQSVSMNGEGPYCGHIASNSEFAIYYFPVTECGTVVMEEPGVIIYENKLFSLYEVEEWHLGKITRDSKFDLLFQCRYTATSVEALVVELLIGDPPLPVAAYGPVRVQMRLGNGQCLSKGCNEVDVAYTSYYMESDYPVGKMLREPVYVEVELLERTDPFVVLTLDHCWTTVSPNAHSYPQWDILIGGCPNAADPYLSELVPVDPHGVAFPGHYRRFLFKMFAFVDFDTMYPTFQQVYIHCSTSLCQARPGGNCEPLCYRKAKREAKTPATKPTTKVVVSRGPVVFQREATKN